MKESHKEALAKGRKKYWDTLKAVNQELDSLSECDKCKMIEWYEKQTDITVDKEHCPIKCRYNKEVVDTNGNNE